MADQMWDPEIHRSHRETVISMAKIMASILSKHTVSSCLEVIHSAGARGFDEGQRYEKTRHLEMWDGGPLYC